ncbi:NUDIX domain-containing protein [Weissella diestrammenae]|uniref:NUDIX domain-containing protein n=1 Tax=Weissella diestrammenae TaxID=1162633 RepID=A0A7G9T3U2_9LACO|nr:NUDIX domain-containing protein [Weissella diestrammenae]MCM0582754.1 NUDIX domain-containing protein [Weissella diestrammenae]QNN74767.1 NUDIX domain-containing protein [Weissella diestrammenae]
MPYQASYVARIREKIGHDTLLVMPTIDVVIEKDNQLMLIYNRDFKGWAFPGGYVEPEMSWQENASREAFEEAGVVVDPNRLQLIGAASGPNFQAKYANGDTTQLFTNVFLATDVQSESQNIDMTEIDQKKWMSKEALKTANLTFSGRAVYEIYRQYQRTQQAQSLKI